MIYNDYEFKTEAFYNYAETLKRAYNFSEDLTHLWLSVLKFWFDSIRLASAKAATGTTDDYYCWFKVLVRNRQYTYWSGEYINTDVRINLEKDIISLAQNFTKRNRNRLWEFFYNNAIRNTNLLTRFILPDKAWQYFQPDPINGYGQYDCNNERWKFICPSEFKYLVLKPDVEIYSQS